MSSAAPAAAVPIASAPAVAVAAPAAAPASPFLASRPLAMWWPAPGIAPPGALAGSTTSSAAAGLGVEGDPPPIANGGPSSSTNAPPPLYGGHPPPSGYGTSSAPISGAQPAPAYGAYAPDYGAPSPPSGWPALTYGAPPSQNYGAPPLQPYAAPQQYGAAFATPYGAPAAPIAPYGAYPSSAYDGAAPAYGASSALTAPAPSLEMAPPVGFYAPPSPAHADPVAPSHFYFSHLLPVKLTPDNYLSWRAQVLPLGVATWRGTSMARCHARHHIIRRITHGWPKIRPSFLPSGRRSRRVSCRWSSSPLHRGTHGRRFTPASHHNLRCVPMLFAPNWVRPSSTTTASRTTSTRWPASLTLSPPLDIAPRTSPPMF